MIYFYFSPIVSNSCVNRVSSHYSYTKCSFMVTLKVPVHIYTPFSIKIGYNENIFIIKNNLQCKVDYNFLYMGQYKIDLIVC